MLLKKGNVRKTELEDFMEDACCRIDGRVPGAGPFFGRLLISIIFILSGIQKIIDFNGSVDALQSFGIQWADFFIIVALLMELIGGILLAFGLFTRVGIVLLMIFLFPTTFIFHGFWNYQDAEMYMQLANFLKNLAIFGGLLALFSFGPGRWSLDACRKTR